MNGVKAIIVCSHGKEYDKEIMQVLDSDKLIHDFLLVPNLMKESFSKEHVVIKEFEGDSKQQCEFNVESFEKCFNFAFQDSSMGAILLSRADKMLERESSNDQQCDDSDTSSSPVNEDTDINISAETKPMSFEGDDSHTLSSPVNEDTAINTGAKAKPVHVSSESSDNMAHDSPSVKTGTDSNIPDSESDSASQPEVADSNEIADKSKSDSSSSSSDETTKREKAKKRSCNFLLRIDLPKGKCILLCGNVSSPIALKYSRQQEISLFQLPYSGKLDANIPSAAKSSRPPLDIQKIITNFLKFRDFVYFHDQPAHLIMTLDSCDNIIDINTLVSGIEESVYEKLACSSTKEFRKNIKDMDSCLQEMQACLKIATCKGSSDMYTALVRRCKDAGCSDNVFKAHPDCETMLHFSELCHKTWLKMCIASSQCASYFSSLINDGKFSSNPVFVFSGHRPQMEVLSGIIKAFQDSSRQLQIAIFHSSVSLSSLCNVTLSKEHILINNVHDKKINEHESDSEVNAESGTSTNVQSLRHLFDSQQAPNTSKSGSSTRDTETASSAKKDLKPDEISNLKGIDLLVFSEENTADNHVECQQNRLCMKPYISVNMASGTMDKSEMHAVDLIAYTEQRKQMIRSLVRANSIWTSLCHSDSHTEMSGIYKASVTEYLHMVDPRKWPTGTSDMETPELGAILPYILGRDECIQMKSPEKLLRAKNLELVHSSINKKGYTIQKLKATLVKLISNLTHWKVVEQNEEHDQTSFKLSATKTSCQSATIVAMDNESDIKINFTVKGIVLIIENAKTDKLRVAITKIKQHRKMKAIELYFDSENSCGTTLADHFLSKGCKDLITKAPRLLVGEVSSILLNPIRACKIFQTLPIAFVSTISDLTINHAHTLVHVEHNPTKLVHGNIFSSTEGESKEISILCSCSKDKGKLETIKLVIEDVTIRILPDYYKNEQSFKISSNCHVASTGAKCEVTCNAKYDRKPAPEMILTLESGKTIEEIVKTLTLPPPDSDSTSLTIPILNISWTSVLKDLLRPKVCLLQNNRYEPNMEVAYISCGYPCEDFLGEFFPSFFKLIDMPQPKVKLLDPYFYPRACITCHVLLDVEFTGGGQIRFDAELSMTGGDKQNYQLILTNPISCVHESICSIMLPKLSSLIGIEFSLPHVIQTMLTDNLELRKMKLFCERCDSKTRITGFSVECFIKEYSLCSKQIILKRTFLKIGYTSDNKFNIECSGIITFLEHNFPLQFSLPTVSNPTSITFDNLTEEFTFSNIKDKLLSHLLEMTEKQDLQKIIPKEFYDLVSNQKLLISPSKDTEKSSILDATLYRIHLELEHSNMCKVRLSSAELTIYLKELKLGNILTLIDCQFFMYIVRDAITESYRFSFFIDGFLKFHRQGHRSLQLTADRSQCLNFSLSYSFEDHCFTGKISAVSSSATADRPYAMSALLGMNCSQDSQESAYNNLINWTGHLDTVLQEGGKTCRASDRLHPSYFILSHAKFIVKCSKTFESSHHKGLVLELLHIQLSDVLPLPGNTMLKELELSYMTPSQAALEKMSIESAKACLVAVLSRNSASDTLKLEFELSNFEESSHPLEISASIQDASLRLKSLLKVVGCERPKLPDVDIPCKTNFFDLHVHKGKLTFTLQPFSLKQFSIDLEADPECEWEVCQSPNIKLLNLMFFVEWEKNKTCFIKFSCTIGIASFALELKALVDSEKVEILSLIIREKLKNEELVASQFQELLEQYPPDIDKPLKIPSDVKLPELQFTAQQASLHMLKMKDIFQMKLEVKMGSAQWNIPCGADNQSLSFREIGGLLHVRTNPKRYLAALFGQITFIGTKIRGLALLGNDDMALTGIFCREDMHSHTSITIPEVANFLNSNSTEDKFESLVPDSFVNKLLPTTAVVHISIKKKQFILCGKLKEFAKFLLFAEYKDVINCVAVVTLNENFSFKDVNENLAFVDELVKVEKARLMISEIKSENETFASIVERISETLRKSSEDFQPYSLDTLHGQKPIPTSLSEMLQSCKHTSFVTDELLEDMKSKNITWPFKEQDHKDYLTSMKIQRGMNIYASLDINSSKSEQIKNLHKISDDAHPLTKFVVACTILKSPESDQDKAHFNACIKSLHLRGGLKFERIELSFKVSKTKYFLILHGTLKLQPEEDWKSYLPPLSFEGDLQVQKEDVKFSSELEVKHSKIMCPPWLFPDMSGNSDNNTIAKLQVDVVYKMDKSKPVPDVTVGGKVLGLFGIKGHEVAAQVLMKGVSVRLVRLRIEKKIDLVVILTKRVIKDIAVVLCGELYYSRSCNKDGLQQVVSFSDESKSRKYRDGLWLECRISILNSVSMIIEVEFPIKDHSFSISGCAEQKIKLFDFINLTNDKFDGGPRIQFIVSERSLSLLVGIEFWNDPWFKGQFSMKSKTGIKKDQPGFEASLQYVGKKNSVLSENCEVVVCWTYTYGLEILKLPILGEVASKASLKLFLSSWKTFANLAYNLIMSNVKVNIEGGFKMETKKGKIPKDCCCVFIWEGDIVIKLLLDFVEIPISLPSIPIAIKRYDKDKHPDFLDYIFDCIWRSTDLIAKSIWNYFQVKNMVKTLANTVVRTVKRTIENVKKFVNSVKQFFGLSEGNSFWIIDKNRNPIAYIEHYEMDSKFAKLFGKPLALKAIQNVAKDVLSGARASQDYLKNDNPNDDSVIQDNMLDEFERYIFRLDKKTQEWTDNGLHVSQMKLINLNSKPELKWKMGAQDDEIDVADLIFTIIITASVVKPNSSIPPGSLLFECNANCHRDQREESTRKNVVYKEEGGWLTLKEIELDTDQMQCCVCVAAEIKTSVSGSVTVDPSAVSTKDNELSGSVNTETELQPSAQEKLQNDIKSKGWKQEVVLSGMSKCTEKFVDEFEPSLSLHFSEDIKFSDQDQCVRGNVYIIAQSSLPSKFFIIIQLYSPNPTIKVCDKSLVLEANNGTRFLSFYCTVHKKLREFRGPFHIRAFAVSTDGEPLSKFQEESNKFRLQQQGNPECLRHRMSSMTCSTFYWKEPGYISGESDANTKDGKVLTYDVTVCISNRGKEVHTFIEKNQRQEYYDCILEDEFQKKGIPLSESGHITLQITTVGTSEKLCSTVTESRFTILEAPSYVNFQACDDAVGLLVKWRIVKDVKCYHILLTNTITNKEYIIKKIFESERDHQKHRHWKEDENNKPRFTFYPSDFKSNTEDDIYIINDDSENDREKTNTDYDEVSIQIGFVDIQECLMCAQVPCEYEMKLYSAGDGYESVRSMIPAVSSQRLCVTGGDDLEFYLNYDMMSDSVEVHLKQETCFNSNFSMQLILVECIKDSTQPRKEYKELTAKVDKEKFLPESRIVISKWRKPYYQQGQEIFACICSPMHTVDDRECCSIAVSSNTLTILDPPKGECIKSIEETFQIFNGDLVCSQDFSIVIKWDTQMYMFSEFNAGLFCKSKIVTVPRRHGHEGTVHLTLDQKLLNTLSHHESFYVYVQRRPGKNEKNTVTSSLLYCPQYTLHFLKTVERGKKSDAAVVVYSLLSLSRIYAFYYTNTHLKHVYRGKSEDKSSQNNKSSNDSKQRSEFEFQDWLLIRAAIKLVHKSRVASFFIDYYTTGYSIETIDMEDAPLEVCDQHAPVVQRQVKFGGESSSVDPDHSDSVRYSIKNDSEPDLSPITSDVQKLTDSDTDITLRIIPSDAELDSHDENIKYKPVNQYCNSSRKKHSLDHGIIESSADKDSELDLPQNELTEESGSAIASQAQSRASWEIFESRSDAEERIQISTVRESVQAQSQDFLSGATGESCISESVKEFNAQTTSESTSRDKQISWETYDFGSEKESISESIELSLHDDNRQNDIKQSDENCGVIEESDLSHQRISHPIHVVPRSGINIIVITVTVEMRVD
jgi:hypothetical protein